MKAMVFTAYGPPEGLRLGEAPTPSPGEGDVLVRVHAASVNSWDWELLNGIPFVNRLTFGLFRPTRILALGADVAGTVEAVGGRVTRFRPGDAVVADLCQNGWGGFAEYVCAPEAVWTAKPEGLGFAEAAAVPQAAVMALQGLRDIGQVQPGQKVLVNGGGGGVGTFAVQMARRFGAEVTGVDSAEKAETMRSLGAERVLDYAREDYTATGDTYDLILDCVVTRPMAHYRRALRPGGSLVLIGGSMARVFQVLLLGPWNPLAGDRNLRILALRPNRNLATILDMVASGQVAPVIDRCYPLHRVPEALRHLGEGHARGKLVIEVVNPHERKEA